MLFDVPLVIYNKTNRSIAEKRVKNWKILSDTSASVM
jgi:hypothetical protein